MLLWLACTGEPAPEETSRPGPGPGSDLPEDTAPPLDTGPATAGAVYVAERPRNLVLIGIDTLRRDALGMYDEEADTPTLAGLFAQGVVLDDHRSCANWTYASMLCVSTGSSNEELGFVPVGGSEGWDGGELGTLTDWVAAAGFSTGYAGATPFMVNRYGLSGPFEVSRNDPEWQADTVTEKALVVLDTLLERDDRFFLQVHYIDPHRPYSAPDAYLGDLEGLEPIDYDLSEPTDVTQLETDYKTTMTAAERRLAREHVAVHYRAETRFADDQIGVLLEELDARGVLDDTLIVLFTDHGEQFWEHGGFGHNEMLYAEENRTGAALWSASMTPGRVTTPTTHADLAPTVLELLGVGRAERITGTTVGESVAHRFALRADEEESWQTVDDGERLLLLRWTGTLEYYRLDEDPDQTSDRFAETDPSEYADLLEALQERVELTDPVLAESSPTWP